MTYRTINAKPQRADHINERGKPFHTRACWGQIAGTVDAIVGPIWLTVITRPQGYSAESLNLDCSQRPRPSVSGSRGQEGGFFATRPRAEVPNGGGQSVEGPRVCGAEEVQLLFLVGSPEFVFHAK